MGGEELNNEIHEQLVQALQEISTRKELQETDRLSDIGLDSIDYLELFFRLKHIMGVELSQEELEHALGNSLRPKDIDPDNWSSAEFFRAFSELSIREVSELLRVAHQQGTFTPIQDSLHGNDSLEINSPAQESYRKNHENLNTPDLESAQTEWSKFQKGVKGTDSDL